MQDFCFNPSNRNYTLKHTAVVILFRKYMQQNERQLLLYQYEIMLINGIKKEAQSCHSNLNKVKEMLGSQWWLYPMHNEFSFFYFCGTTKKEKVESIALDFNILWNSCKNLRSSFLRVEGIDEDTSSKCNQKMKKSEKRMRNQTRRNQFDSQQNL